MNKEGVDKPKNVGGMFGTWDIQSEEDSCQTPALCSSETHTKQDCVHEPLFISASTTLGEYRPRL